MSHDVGRLYREFPGRERDINRLVQTNTLFSRFFSAWLRSTAQLREELRQNGKASPRARSIAQAKSVAYLGMKKILK